MAARPRKFDEDAVLDGATEVFWRRGYEGTTVDALEEHLGVGRQSLYNTFGDKRALFRRVVARYAASSHGVRSFLEADPSGLPGIRRYFEGLVDFLAGKSGGLGCLLVRSMTSAESGDEQVARTCGVSDEALRSAFRSALSVAVERGEVRPDLPLEAAVLMLTAQAYGLSTLTSHGASREELAAAAAMAVAGLDLVG